MTIIELPDRRNLDMNVSGPDDGMPLVEGHVSISMGAMDRMLDELLTTVSS
jgi:hypothetical protein